MLFAFVLLKDIDVHVVAVDTVPVTFPVRLPTNVPDVRVDVDGL